MIVSTPILEKLRNPAWEIVQLFPERGEWTEEDYLDLSDRTNRLIELSAGVLEVLPLPSLLHQRIAMFLCDLIRGFLGAEDLGEVVMAPYPVRLRQGKFREPDLLVMLKAHLDRLQEDCAERPDVVIEIISKDRRRDLVTKRREYALAGIPEYWLVDPVKESITVFKLSAQTEARYAVLGRFTAGQDAHSRVLRGFRVSVSAVLSAGK